MTYRKQQVFKYQQQFAELIFSGNYTRELYYTTLNALNSARAALTSVQVLSTGRRCIMMFDNRPVRISAESEIITLIHERIIENIQDNLTDDASEIVI